MVNKILNFEKTLKKLDLVAKRSAVLERELIVSKQREQDLQREIRLRNNREKLLGLILVLSNICWLVLFITSLWFR